MGLLLGSTDVASNAANGSNNMIMVIGYVVFIIAIMYFLMIRPQKKEEQKKRDLMSSLAIGDSVLTTAGFYGIIIDMTNDTVIVEFGNNKNCRIPMQKSSIVKSEKPNYSNISSDTGKK